ncbi:MAG TPA: phenylalanine--tRNA ligase subunit beta [Acidimicrobiales bacterium]|nr:phenylalanine--tRNA ligase subunit beta [Acidimicrobiales bacterium]
MRVPLSWLTDFAPFDDEPAAIAATLDDLGLVVEGLERVGEGLEDVVVSRVLEIAPIPAADKIRRVVVEAGGEPVEVVCGAWNFEVGDLVPLAPVGAVLPGGFEIARRKMKGVVSNGMLCSGRELGLSEDHQGILVLGAADGGADADAPAPGVPLMAALGITADVVFDIAVETNRPDAWSVAGVARDLAARYKLPFAVPALAGAAPAPAPGPVPTSIEVVDDDLCPRFTARVLTGVTVGPSPAWVVRRLALAGVRAINNVVDASNYVMLELGQPTHPYDLDRVAGGGLRIRAARPDEQVTTLDGVVRTMGTRSVAPVDDRRDCLICDAEDAPIGIGGIMGGESTEITESTTNVLLEAAYFDPMAIARTSKRLALRTEASARFERGCDPEGIDAASLRLCTLLGASAGERARLVDGVVDRRGAVPGAVRVPVRVARVNAILGAELDDGDVAGYLEPIGFVCERSGPGVLEVTVPTFRPDAAREIDVVEEVARHHGYSRLPRQRPLSEQVGRLDPYQRDRRAVRSVVAGWGAHEAWTPSLLAPGDHARAGLEEGGITVTNPLSPDESVLRRSLLPGMLGALAFNNDRRQGELRLFEMGHVFPPPPPERVARALARTGETVVDERELLAVVLAEEDDDAAAAAGAWKVLAGELGVDVGMVAPGAMAGAGAPGGLHPTRSAWLVLGGGPRSSAPGGGGAATGGDAVVGAVGEIDPAVLEAWGIDATRRRVGWLEVDLGALLVDAPRRSPVVGPISRFPSSDVDLAFVVRDSVAAAVLEATLREAAGDLLEHLVLFDAYRGEGVPDDARSLAYRLRLCSVDRTLTDADVAEVRARCIAAVARAQGATLRA